ncbi:MAG: hypothetical protein AB1567_05815, partial [bacterium]
ELREYVVMRFNETNNRIDEANKRIDETNNRIDELRDSLTKKIDHHFYWTIGLFAPLVLSVISGVIIILVRGF